MVVGLREGKCEIDREKLECYFKFYGKIEWVKFVWD